MQITFNLPHVFNPYASEVENGYVLRALLDCLIKVNLAYLQNHPALPLYQSGVVYGRTKLWEPIPALYERGFGDCKSLSAALIAQKRNQGISCVPCFRFVQNKDGSRDFHILVQAGEKFVDPSKRLGMNNRELRRFYEVGRYQEG